MPRFAQLLVEMGACSHQQIREAMQNRAIFGGRLGTNLLELGSVTEEQLARALGQRHRLPLLYGDTALDPSALALLPAEAADRLDVVPYRVEGRRLQLLVCDPEAVRTIDEVAFTTGKLVQPIVVPEARLWHLLRQGYGLERQLRGLEVAFARPEHTPTAAGPAGPPSSRGSELESSSEDLQDEASFQAVYAKSLGMAASKATRPPEPAPFVVPAPEAPLIELSAADINTETITPLSFDEAVRTLSGVGDREAIAQTVLRYARSKFQRAVLLTVQRGHALGWEGLGEGLSTRAVRRIRVPLEVPSAFATAVTTRAHYLGPLQRTEANIRFLRTLAGGAPKNCFLIPILVQARVVNILYVDNGRGGLVDPEVGELLILATRISQSYDTLIAAHLAA